jgi:hypothetical protein
MIEGRYTTMSDQSAYHGPAYPTEEHDSIPAFNSYEEEANFWDTHSKALHHRADKCCSERITVPTQFPRASESKRAPSFYPRVSCAGTW